MHGSALRQASTLGRFLDADTGSRADHARTGGRRDDERLLRTLWGFEPLRELSQGAVAELAPLVALRVVPRGQTLFRAGEPSDTLFLVASGRFYVFLDGAAEPVAEIAAGEPVGELAFLTAEVRSATIVAARDSEILEISRRAYELLLRHAPSLQRMLLLRLAERMRRMAPAARPLRRSPPRTIALCRIGDAPIPADLAPRLAQALSAYGRTEVVPNDLILSGRERIEAVLNRLERECRFVLCPVDETQGEGARHALRHCDSVILVGRQSADATHAPSGALERDCFQLFLQRSRALLLWRERSAMPIAGSAGWLQERPVDLHHHLALDEPADMARLARFIAGRALGAVFGGGGALGCAHLGLVRAFRDAGVTFDILGGTSAGAAMALALATGISPEELMERTEEIFVRKRAMQRYTLPFFSSSTTPSSTASSPFTMATATCATCRSTLTRYRRT